MRDSLTIAPASAKRGRSSLPGPTSSSVAALRAYSEGEQLARENKNQDALAKFQAAIKEDPQFALAFAKLAQTYHALGYGKEAEQATRDAARLGETLPQEQRYLIDAMRAGIANDTDKAIEAYERLRQMAPNDSQLLFDLARLYEAKAISMARATCLKRVLELDPRYVAALHSDRPGGDPPAQLRRGAEVSAAGVQRGGADRQRARERRGAARHGRRVQAPQQAGRCARQLRAGAEDPSRHQ